MFWVKGKIDGKEYRLRWHEGVVRGDDLAQYRLRQLAKKHEEAGDKIGVPGYIRLQRNYLAVDITALMLMRELFTGPLETGGTLPETPELPEGAVA